MGMLRECRVSFDSVDCPDEEHLCVDRWWVFTPLDVHAPDMSPRGVRGVLTYLGWNISWEWDQPALRAGLAALHLDGSRFPALAARRRQSKAAGADDPRFSRPMPTADEDPRAAGARQCG